MTLLPEDRTGAIPYWRNADRERSAQRHPTRCRGQLAAHDARSGRRVSRSPGRRPASRGRARGPVNTNSQNVSCASGLGLRDSTVEKRQPAFKRMIRIRHRTPCAGLTARIDRQQPRTCTGRAVGLSASVRPDPADVSGASRSSSRNTVVRTPLYPARCPTTHAWSTTAPGHSVAPLDRPPDAMMNHGLRHRHLGRWLVDKHPHW